MMLEIEPDDYSHSDVHNIKAFLNISNLIVTYYWITRIEILHIKLLPLKTTARRT